MATYADDNTPCNFSRKLNAAFRRLKNYTVQIFESFHKNCFEFNVDKCNLIATANSQKGIQIG